MRSRVNRALPARSRSGSGRRLEAPRAKEAQDAGDTKDAEHLQLFEREAGEQVGPAEPTEEVSRFDRS